MVKAPLVSIAAKGVAGLGLLEIILFFAFPDNRAKVMLIAAVIYVVAAVAGYTVMRRPSPKPR